jgi:hypothetical protein
MNSPEISVDIFNPQGSYPSRMVVCDSIAYLVSSGIPMLVSESQADDASRWERGKRRKLLFGAFLLTRKSFPCFSFHPFPTASMYFKNTSMADVMSKVVAVVNGKDELPCLYNTYMGNGDGSDPVAYIKHLRSLDAYIDLFHAPQIPFSDLIESLEVQYTIRNQHFRPEFVAGLFKRLTGSSRLIHIAVHYFVNAARLIHEHFIEDAGLNLNLVLEAIIEDIAWSFWKNSTGHEMSSSLISTRRCLRNSRILMILIDTATNTLRV